MAGKKPLDLKMATPPGMGGGPKYSDPQLQTMYEAAIANRPAPEIPMTPKDAYQAIQMDPPKAPDAPQMPPGEQEPGMMGTLKNLYQQIQLNPYAASGPPTPQAPQQMVPEKQFGPGEGLPPPAPPGPMEGTFDNIFKGYHAKMMRDYMAEERKSLAQDLQKPENANAIADLNAQEAVASAPQTNTRKQLLKGWK